MLSTLYTCEATTARSCWRLEMPALLAMRRKVKKFHHYFHHYQSSLQQVVIEQASNNVKVLSIRYMLHVMLLLCLTTTCYTTRYNRLCVGYRREEQIIK